MLLIEREHISSTLALQHNIAGRLTFFPSFSSETELTPPLHLPLSCSSGNAIRDRALILLSQTYTTHLGCFAEAVVYDLLIRRANTVSALARTPLIRKSAKSRQPSVTLKASPLLTRILEGRA